MDVLKEAVEMDGMQYDQDEAQPDQEDFMDPALFGQGGFDH